MISIKNKPIAFTSDGTLIIFDSREESAKWMTDREENDYEIWAEPKWLLRTLRELEKEVEEKDNENEVMTLDSISQFNGMRREAEREQAGEEGLGVVSENAVRAIKMREDDRQRRLLEGGEE